MENSIEIREAIKSLSSERGYALSEIAKKLNVAASTVIRWVNGTAKEIRNSHWVKLYPLIQNHLEPLEVPYISPDKIRQDMTAAGHVIVEPAQHRVPVISFAQAHSFDPIMEPIEELLSDPIAYATFHTPIKEGMFAIRIDGDSMEPMIPDGSFALLDSHSLPRTGKPCVCKLSNTGQVVCKIWSWRNSEINLTSINPEGNNYGPWNKQQAHNNLLFRYPIIELNIRF